MPAKPVEWVLVVFYGPESHRATYGRQVKSNKYTKDYIQLSRKADFLAAVENLFLVSQGETSSVPLIFKWPTGSTPGAFIFKSSDRPHLKWETALGAPQAWKMTPNPDDSTAQTIPGNPSYLDFEAAENEFKSLATRGAGQPYLMAVKLRDEPRTLHLRAYLGTPDSEYTWASLARTPTAIQQIASRTSQNSALAWSIFQSGGSLPSVEVANLLHRYKEGDWDISDLSSIDPILGRSLAAYIRNPAYGLFFDSEKNHDAWKEAVAMSADTAASIQGILEALDTHFPALQIDDAAAEAVEFEPTELEAFRTQIQVNNFEVPDSLATVKTRGSAQRAFAEAVKANYHYRCAITGITTRDFLVASHIVPWSEDRRIRLDPSNGICLSLVVDRAFEKGFLLIDDSLRIRVNWNRLSQDSELSRLLREYDGKELSAPRIASPKIEYLRRRRALFT